MAPKHPVLIDAIETYKRIFGGDPSVKVFAPGRVNLIGEHTDYNDGYVLPFALPFKTIVVGSLSSGESKIASVNMQSEVVSFKVDRDLVKGQPEWANYVKGTIYQYIDDLPKDFAFNAVVASNVPIGSGLSSSASLEVAIATFLEKLCNITHVSGVTKALRCQQAEHVFGGTPCGIMDQYISAMGKKDNLLLIDCRSKDYRLVPYSRDSRLRPPVLLVTNSAVHHSLADGEYAVRVQQCQEAVRVLSEKFPHITALRDASIENLEAVRECMDELVFARALHCITEDARTLATVAALEKGDFKKVGEYMTCSHESLREYYEVSCKELDFLVDTALEVPGVLGSRMTGGGFGGCTITLVERDSVRTLEMHLKAKYNEEFGLNCVCYECLPSTGAGDCDSMYSSRYSSDKKEEESDGASLPWIVASCTVGVIAAAALYIMTFRRQ
mmetsp:Transcript_26454/g.39276  ORF Transcript_26454/g.39276 Transcript_26454/m.39276 type:complete len:442 (+) Transcript_26454:48-1373(+)|eukprot:CAMPEP_0185031162 /NCGR_PEP_ID=MMETSP1103-20130426/18477_1 /TAXON_ID=36769 /ORGANISM="Paraphysomonas bandaiensis, Strain Caron Lab Isolate" /LENGTH=441 /DNA_ID=CAMNT_0027566589 /DNA_START=1 /DNA_END=1326 /DNA_ORIENTATION=+